MIRKVVLGLAVTAILVGCASSAPNGTGAGSGSSSDKPLSANDVTGHNHFYYDEVQTPDGVVDCVIWVPERDPGLSCNWQKFDAEHPSVPSTTTTTTTTQGF